MKNLIPFDKFINEKKEIDIKTLEASINSKEEKLKHWNYEKDGDAKVEAELINDIKSLKKALKEYQEEKVIEVEKK